MTRPLLLMLALIAAPAASAADYLLLRADPAGAMLLDRDSIRRSGDSAEVSVLYRHDREVAATAAVPAHRAVRTRYLIDCKASRLAVAERLYLRGSTTAPPVKRETMPGPRLASPTDQSERMVLATVCPQ